MKTINGIFFLLFLHSTNLFGQNPAVDKLKDAQDSRKKILNFGSNNTDIVKAPSKTTFVNPFIGTGGHGHTYPGASAPFGMIQISPDTRFDGWDGCSGYHYSDSVIYGFSHTHLSGVGVPDYCDLLIVPQCGQPKTTPGYKSKEGYGSKFNHSKEKASPGFYEVSLLDSKIDAKITTGERSGMHEYTFLSKNGKKYILLDLDHRDELLSSTINIIDKKTISGSRISKSWAEEQHFYFHLETNIPFKKAKRIKKNGQHKLLLQFPENTDKIILKIGISAVDINGAANNLKNEISDWDFNYLLSKTVKNWNTELDKIQFYAEDQELMKTFYTALYHSYLNPNIFNDFDGRYRGQDHKIHTLKSNEKQFSVFSLWDTYRSTHPLFTLTQKSRTIDFIQTFLRQFEENGDLPVWELAGNETDCMIGYHSVSVIADAYSKGLIDFDTQKALNAMITTSTLDELGKKSFSKFGFISLSEEPESVSKSLEYAYDDFCISRFSKLIENKKIENEYALRSFNFINLYDPSTKFMRARRNGLWYSPFDPTEVNFNYTEANSWQYSLYAPHAVGVLRNLIGGKDSLSNWLDRLFTTNTKLSGRDQVDITGLIGQYAHGNEPSHHISYLYNYTNQAHKTQFYTDKIMKEMYSNQPDGLSGNEDCGQMSSWYVLSAMGLYQIAPGNPYYDFGRPLAKESIIELENNKRFRIKTINNSSENKYIQKITLNGLEINRLFISHDEIMNSGELVFEMGNKPNPIVDTYYHAPTINDVPENFTPVAYFEEVNRTFDDSMKISINYPKLNSRIYEIKYTTDGTEPTLNSQTYLYPISIKNSTTIKALLINPTTKKLGSSISNDFVKTDKTISIILKSNYAPQYSASGKNALIDGITGGKEYRTGDWQGFNGQDLVAEISFSTPKKVSEIGLNCIQDMKSWIFFPQSVQYEISIDGINFISLTTAISPSNKLGNPETQWFFPSQTNTNEPIRKIRITAKSFGKCPEGHLGYGNDTWLFADEIILR
jgi:predicted alpha-1,2-mannosidase